jgi:hypothetical protein
MAHRTRGVPGPRGSHHRWEHRRSLLLARAAPLRAPPNGGDGRWRRDGCSPGPVPAGWVASQTGLDSSPSRHAAGHCARIETSGWRDLHPLAEERRAFENGFQPRASPARAGARADPRSTGASPSARARATREAASPVFLRWRRLQPPRPNGSHDARRGRITRRRGRITRRRGRITRRRGRITRGRRQPRVEKRRVREPTFRWAVERGRPHRWAIRPQLFPECWRVPREAITSHARTRRSMRRNPAQTSGF